MSKAIYYTFFALFATLQITCPHLLAASRSIQVVVNTPEGKRIDLYRESYALVIGNGNYRNGWDPLPGALRDVREVATALKKQGFRVSLKTDLTKDSFSRVFGKFVLTHGRREDNRLLFYYAGHGHTQKMTTGEELGYLVMVDAPAPEKEPVEFSLASVDMQNLVTQAKLIRSKHVLFMFDSCFSGTVLNLRKGVAPKRISDKIRYPVRQFITAGRANEPVPDHSVFKQAFLDLLEGRAPEPIPDGYITGEELGLFLKNTVPEYNPLQHPQYGKIREPRLDKGDFVFTKTQPVPQAYTDEEPTRKQLEELTQQLAVLKRQLQEKNLEKNPPQAEKTLIGIGQAEKKAGPAPMSERLDSKQKAADTPPHDGQPPVAKLARLGEEQERIASKYTSRYKLAIFPWVEKSETVTYRGFFKVALNKAIEDTEVFVPLFSYYDLKNKFSTRTIKDVMVDYPAKDLYNRPKMFSKIEPKVDLISRLGKELQVDAVLVGRLDIRISYSGRTESDYMTIFSASIVDIDSKRKYHLRKFDTLSSPDDMVNYIRSGFKRLFIDYHDKESQYR